MSVATTSTVRARSAVVECKGPFGPGLAYLHSTARHNPEYQNPNSYLDQTTLLLEKSGSMQCADMVKDSATFGSYGQDFRRATIRSERSDRPACNAALQQIHVHTVLTLVQRQSISLMSGA